MNLTAEQIEDYKYRLRERRKQIVSALQDSSVEGMWSQVVDKYSDQAHFLYEILQNADDASATCAKFILKDNELIFKHNGKRLFSISDVNTEREDKKNGILGDINAITSVGQSNKIDSAKIGKFGMGFKSVFQYTRSPIIYDDNFRFRITDYMIPNWVDSDFEGRNKGETIFIFPFDKSELKPENAKKEILEKLEKLILPVLFLHSMEKIEYECDDKKGIYSKEELERIAFEDATAVRYKIINNSKDDVTNLWLFTRISEEGHSYSVGYFIDEKGYIIPKTNYHAFCFFPTKVVTHLNFLIHAPFLLTDSREGIKANSDHNHLMIELLATLAADSLKFFIKIGERYSKRIVNDDITEIIPVQKSLFDGVSSETVSFMPFYSEIQEKLKNGLLPTEDGYVSATVACWADTLPLTRIFNNDRLSQCFKNQKLNWVFISKAGRRNNAELSEYLDEIGVRYITLEKLLKEIDESFTEGQSIEWLCSLYEIILSNQQTIKVSQNCPIFLNSERKAYAAFEGTEPKLFRSSSNSDGYNVILSILEENKFAIELLDKIGVAKPVLRDKIYKKTLPKIELDEISDFKDFLDYFIECQNKNDRTNISNLIADLKERKFIATIHANGECGVASAPIDNLYLLNDELKIYFAESKTTIFVNENKYTQILSEEEKRSLRPFLLGLGVEEAARKIEKEIDVSDPKNPFKSVYSTREKRSYKYFLDGAEDFLPIVVNKKELAYSKILFHQMAFGLSRFCKLFGFRCDYFYQRPRWDSKENKNVDDLFKNQKWLLDSDGNWVSPSETFLQRLAENYNISGKEEQELLENYLGVHKEHPEYDSLSADIRKKVELSDLLEKNGINELSAEDIAWLKQKRQKRSQQIDNTRANSDSGNIVNHNSENEAETAENEKNDISPETQITREISERAQKKRIERELPSAEAEKHLISDDSDDEDEYTKASIDYAKKIERIKDKCAVEVSELREYQTAQNLATSAKKYSYQWFSALLKLELLASNEENFNSREVSISFGKVEKDSSTQKTLILKQPNKNIPSIIEELYGVNLELRLKDGSLRSLPFDSASIRSFSLRIKLMHADQLLDLDLSQVVSASINAKSPVFLLKSLQEQFDALNFEATYDMQQSLCENIKFVFGPPGTGKTTYLVKNILQPLVSENPNIKILVLTPTNKAADVIVNRFKESYPDDLSYENWLIRFGVTNDEEIEGSKIFCSRNYSFEGNSQTVMVTTIARLPYDSMIDDKQQKTNLRDIEWDYIVVDEASMIPLVQMTYLLYSQKPKQFIIAGDPFQIEPTVAVDMWKDENIYKMVHLNSFTQVQTTPHAYEVVTLKTQYRSIPSVGKIFSELTYGGVLEHARKEEERKPLNIETYLDYDSLNLVKFPMYRYESIYKSKRLGKSSYQVYSAIFAYEFACYIAKSIAKENIDGTFKIGIISPYGAQAKLINNLLLTERFPDRISVQSGTIHGFQGDECDVLLTVFNPPEGISASSKMFLNHQNIINVAISRARDYLFVLMPDEKTEKIENLALINRVESLMRENNLCKIIESHELEEKMFGNRNYLEENTFSTGHQSVNVYGIPEKTYEVRSEDEAIDIQLHKNDKFHSL